MNADFDLHINLVTLVSLAGACFAAAMAYRRSLATRAPEEVADAPRPDGGPERRAPLLNAAAAPPSNGPRSLLAPASFLGAVDAAIPASLRQSRSVGLLYVRCAVDRSDPMMRAAALNVAGDAILKAFRPTDPITRLESGDFVVALPLLADRRHIATIEARLLRIADEAALAIGSPVGVLIGSAMYPINGYNAQALVASARDGMRLDTVDANGQRVRIKPKIVAGSFAEAA